MAVDLAAALRQHPEKAADLCEAVISRVSSPALLELAYAVRLLLHLSSNELSDARFLWRSVPATLSKAIELNLAWKVGAALFARDLVSASAICSQGPWSAAVQPFADSVMTNQRDAAASAMSVAYSSVSPATFAAGVALPSDAAVQCAFWLPRRLHQVPLFLCPALFLRCSPSWLGTARALADPAAS